MCVCWGGVCAIAPHRNIEAASNAAWEDAFDGSGRQALEAAAGLRTDRDGYLQCVPASSAVRPSSALPSISMPCHRHQLQSVEERRSFIGYGYHGRHLDGMMSRMMDAKVGG